MSNSIILPCLPLTKVPLAEVHQRKSAEPKTVVNSNSIEAETSAPSEPAPDGTIEADGHGPTLNAKHLAECVNVRGLDYEWIRANCKSVDAHEATQYLGYEAKGPCLQLQGCNGQFQMKPDRPWRSEEDAKLNRKAAKYRSNMGDYDAMLPTHPDDPNYWRDIESLKRRAYKIESCPCLLLTAPMSSCAKP